MSTEYLRYNDTSNPPGRNHGAPPLLDATIDAEPVLNHKFGAVDISLHTPERY